MAPTRIVTGLGAAILLLVACSSGTTTRGPSPAPSAPAAYPTDLPRDFVPAPSPPPKTRPDPLTIAVAGDIHFEGALRGRLDDPTTALSPIVGPLSAADLTIVNLETAIGSGGQPAPDKRFLFQAPPTAFDALAAAGVDVATMANNHVLDFGRGPLPRMFAAVEEAPLDVVGVGRVAEDAFAPALTTISGTTVATIGATTAGLDPTADPTGQWAATDTVAGTADAIDPAMLLRAVANADRTADVVVVYLHWGIQGEGCPDGNQQSLAADLVAAGADIIVGSHTHQLQGDGRLGEGYVAYGLGNFAWYTQSATTRSTGVLTLTVQPAGSPRGRARVTAADWTPARIGADGLPRPTSRAEADDFDVDREFLRSCAGLTAP